MLAAGRRHQKKWCWWRMMVGRERGLLLKGSQTLECGSSAAKGAGCSH
jgi:hypothetical protein